MLIEKKFYPRGTVYTKRMMKGFLFVFKLNANIFQTPVLWQSHVYQSLIPDNTQGQLQQIVVLPVNSNHHSMISLVWFQC